MSKYVSNVIKKSMSQLVHTELIFIQYAHIQTQ